MEDRVTGANRIMGRSVFRTCSHEVRIRQRGTVVEAWITGEGYTPSCEWHARVTRVENRSANPLPNNALVWWEVPPTQSDRQKSPLIYRGSTIYSGGFVVGGRRSAGPWPCSEPGSSPGDPQFFHPAPQGGRFQSQPRRRPIRPLNDPSALFEGLQKMAACDLVKAR